MHAALENPCSAIMPNRYIEKTISALVEAGVDIDQQIPSEDDVEILQTPLTEYITDIRKRNAF